MGKVGTWKKKIWVKEDFETLNEYALEVLYLGEHFMFLGNYLLRVGKVRRKRFRGDSKEKEPEYLKALLYLLLLLLPES